MGQTIGMDILIIIVVMIDDLVWIDFEIMN